MSHRVQGDADALITIIALQRYKAKTGQYPESLDELLKEKYLKQMPMDPFSDKQFVYKKTDNNFILYSYACDFDDDGGKHVGWKQYDDGDYIYWPTQE
jgi:hypothetical protein